MVSIISLRPFRGDEGYIKPRTRMDVSDKRADQLVKKGLATYDLGARTVGAPANKMVVPPATKEALPAGGAADPSPEPQAGSQTGEGKKPRSSSRRARRPKK